MRFFIVPALLAATVALPAIAAPLQHFTRDGEDYSYTAQRQPNGVVLLNGTVDATGERFALRVRGTQVVGRLGMSDVSFTVSHETAERLAEEVSPATETTTLAAN